MHKYCVKTCQSQLETLYELNVRSPRVVILAPNLKETSASTKMPSTSSKHFVAKNVPRVKILETHDKNLAFS